MSQISEHINSTNNKIHSCDQMSKIIVNLGSKKGDNNDNSSTQLSCPNNSLLMRIVYTSTKDLTNIEGKADKIKVLIS